MNIEPLAGTLLACSHGKMAIRRGQTLVLKTSEGETVLDDGTKYGAWAQAVFGYEGKAVVTLTEQGHRVKVWIFDSDEPQQRMRFSPKAVLLVADDTLIAIAREDGEVVVISWSVMPFARIPPQVVGKAVSRIDITGDTSLVITYGDESVVVNLRP